MSAGSIISVLSHCFVLLWRPIMAGSSSDDLADLLNEMLSVQERLRKHGALLPWLRLGKDWLSGESFSRKSASSLSLDSASSAQRASRPAVNRIRGLGKLTALSDRTSSLAGDCPRRAPMHLVGHQQPYI